MPKVKQNLSNKLNVYVSQYPDFKTDGKVLFCKVCNNSLSSDKVFAIKQHLESSKHIQLNAKSSAKKAMQLFIGEKSLTSLHAQFPEDLCNAFIAADIPLYKVRHPKIKYFIEKYTDHKVPSETSLRSNHVKHIYKATIENIRTDIKNRFLWLSIDETTDAAGKYVANVIIGILDCEKIIASKKYLLNTVVLDSVNHSTIARLFDDSVKILGAHFDRDLILLFISDAAPYMIKAAQAIIIFYPKITHLTCLAHGLHRVCEQIRMLYPNVDRLIANIKKVFLKAPSRVKLFKILEPDLSMPPQPAKTRWGTWLQATNYYAKNFEKICAVFDALDKEDAAAIKISQDLLNNITRNELLFISSNYGFLEGTITALEAFGQPLDVQIKLVTDASDLINSINTEFANPVKEKMAKIIEKNYGFSILKNISACLTGQAVHETANHKGYSLVETMAFKFAPITSVDVERSFSMYKNVFRSNRQSFLFENLREIFIIYCNNNLN